MSAGDVEAVPDAFTIVTLVSAHADNRRFSKQQTAFDLRNILIDMGRANELRIRNGPQFESGLRHHFVQTLLTSPNSV